MTLKGSLAASDSSVSTDSKSQEAESVKEQYSIKDRKNYYSQGGYDGQSMSNRAREVYENGEKTLSKWSKTAILEDISTYSNVSENVYEPLKTLTLTEMRSNLLRHSSYHHTGAFYNATEFYEIDFDYVESLSVEDIDAIKNGRKPRAKKTYEEKARDREEKEIKQRVNERYEYLYHLFENQSKHKTLNRAYRLRKG